MTLAVSQDFKDALMVGGLQAWLDNGVGNASLLVYNGTQPAAGAALSGNTLLVTITLDDPATTFAANKLTLVQGDLSGDLIMNQGSATWARMMNASGAWAADGTVSDAAGSGDFKVSGTTGTLLYAGARAILGLTRWG